MDKYKIAIVIPAFNEETTIYDVVQSVEKYGLVIVVNDASIDRTKQMAEDAGAIVVSHKENQGYDGALNSGFLKAEMLNCKAVVTFDADGQHSAEFIEKLITMNKETTTLLHDFTLMFHEPHLYFHNICEDNVNYKLNIHTPKAS